MKIVKLSQAEHEEIKDIISYADFDNIFEDKKSIELIIDKKGGIIKEALDISNYLPNIQPAQYTQNVPSDQSALNAVQQGVQQGLTSNEIANPGSTALQGIQSAQQGTQQINQQQNFGQETPNWKPQMRGQGADLFTQNQQGAGQLIPVIFEGAIDPQSQQVQVWNTQTNSKQWVPMASIFETGTQRPYPFAGTQAETSPGNMINPPVQAKQDLKEFYERLSYEKDSKEKEAWLQYAPEIVSTIKLLWDVYQEYKDVSGDDLSSQEEKIACIKESFDIQAILSGSGSFVNFLTDIFTNPDIRKHIESKLTPETVQKIESILDFGPQVIDFINKQISTKTSSDLIQINSEVLLLKKGSDLYDSIEDKLLKIAKQNDLDDINGITVEITPKQFKIAYLKNNKIAYRIVTAEGESEGGILSTVLNMAKPVYQITKDNPNLTGGMAALASIGLAKAQGQDWNIFDNGLVPFLGGKFGGPLTMAAIGGTQAAGMEGLSKWALILGGFLLDNAMKSSMEEDENKKAELAEQQQNMSQKLSTENPRFMQLVTSYWRQMQQQNPNYSLQQARSDFEKTFPESVASSIYNTIEKIASIKNIKEADSVHISITENNAILRFKNANEEPVPNPVPTQPAPEPQPESPAEKAIETPQQEQSLIPKETEDKFKADLEQLNSLMEQNSSIAQNIAGSPTGGENDVQKALEGKSDQIKLLADQIMANPEYKPLLDQMNNQIPKIVNSQQSSQIQPDQQQVGQQAQPVSSSIPPVEQSPQQPIQQQMV